MTRSVLVVLRVLTDDPDLEWWQAMGLPDPSRWSMSDTFSESVFPEVVTEEELATS